MFTRLSLGSIFYFRISLGLARELPFSLTVRYTVQAYVLRIDLWSLDTWKSSELHYSRTKSAQLFKWRFYYLVLLPCDVAGRVCLFFICFLQRIVRAAGLWQKQWRWLAHCQSRTKTWNLRPAKAWSPSTLLMAWDWSKAWSRGFIRLDSRSHQLFSSVLLSPSSQVPTKPIGPFLLLKSAILQVHPMVNTVLWMSLSDRAYFLLPFSSIRKAYPWSGLKIWIWGWPVANKGAISSGFGSE